MFGELYNIKLIIPNVGEVKGDLYRIKGPHLTEKIFSALPINTRCLKRNDMLIIPINILYAVEKPEHSGSVGDIIYEPNSKSLIIPLKTIEFNQKVAKIGKITHNFSILKKLKGSAGVRIDKIN